MGIGVVSPRQLGPGIRKNGDTEPEGKKENDRILLTFDIPKDGADVTGVTYRLTRSSAGLNLLTTADGYIAAIPFGDGNTATFDPADKQLFAEWANDAATHPTLTLERLVDGKVVASDKIVFHVFSSVVVVLGGLNQTPDDTTENTDTFKMAYTLYRQGYDVWMYDEAKVNPDNVTNSDAFKVITNALVFTGATKYAVFGYSKGGGKTRLVIDAVFADRGDMSASFAGYIDGVITDMKSDITRPKATYFSNFYHGNRNVLLDTLGGKPVPLADHELNVNTVDNSITHGDIDDKEWVQSAMIADLKHVLKGNVQP